jgi:hypothetical protein
VSVSKAPAFKAALFTAITAVMPSGVRVTYGHPGAIGDDDIVAVRDVSFSQEVSTMSAQRSREETITCQVQFSCWRGGTDQQTVTERAYYLLGLLEQYVQDPGTVSSVQITLGGVVRDCRVTSAELVEGADPDDLARAHFRLCRPVRRR